MSTLAAAGQAEGGLEFAAHGQDAASRRQFHGERCVAAGAAQRQFVPVEETHRIVAVDVDGPVVEQEALG
ncbi:MAG: hypothetical protein R3A10_01250 [Caldilineaceae bacterium]